MLDGTPVDWAAAESGAEPAVRPVIQQLRLLHGLAAVHRREPASAATRSWTPAIFANPALVPAPERWGHLKILDRIGRGAFGAVYRAWDSRLDREVALKLLPAPRDLGDQPSSTIIEEGRLLARVRHANVVTIHGAEQIGDQIGLWMELVRGQTLEQLLQRGTAFNAADTTAIGIELCNAVAAVHVAGLLHRDIKAHNVTRADDGRIVLMDFGAGRELDDGSSSDLTGTPLYLAPEVFRGEPATVQSDLYCLGVLLYHLLTGKYPVQGRTLADVRAAHEQGQRTTLKAARPDLPPALVRVIDRAIDPNPAARYQSAQALAADLTALVGASRKPFKYIAAVAAVLVVATGITLERGWRPFGPPPRPPRVAVLPFENLSAEPGSDVFALGLTDELRRHLTAVKGIALLSFDSSSAFPTKGRDLRQIRDELHADLILEGSIFRAADVLRINARLVQVADGVAIWYEKFDRTMSDVFAVQDEISLAIVTRLRLKTQWQKRYETRVELHDLFLRARALMLPRDGSSAQAAAALYQQVVDGDPEYAPAWAGLATALALAGRRARDLPRDDLMEAAARRAIQLDENLAEAQAARGTVLALERNWTMAETAFRRAIELNASEIETSLSYIETVLEPQGRFEDALRLVETALSIDPYVRRHLAHLQVDSGRYEAAIENARWWIEREPAVSYAHRELARALYLSGRLEEALPILEGPADDMGCLGYLYARLGRRADAEALAVTLADRPAQQMLVYAGLGDKERTFEAFKQTVTRNWWRALRFVHRPELEIIRDDPRVVAIKRQFGLDK